MRPENRFEQIDAATTFAQNRGGGGFTPDLDWGHDKFNTLQLVGVSKMERTTTIFGGKQL
jgi:hypothetical protein